MIPLYSKTASGLKMFMLCKEKPFCSLDAAEGYRYLIQLIVIAIVVIAIVVIAVSIPVISGRSWNSGFFWLFWDRLDHRRCVGMNITDASWLCASDEEIG